MDLIQELGFSDGVIKIVTGDPVMITEIALIISNLPN